MAEPTGSKLMQVDSECCIKMNNREHSFNACYFSMFALMYWFFSLHWNKQLKIFFFSMLRLLLFSRLYCFWFSISCWAFFLLNINVSPGDINLIPRCINSLTKHFHRLSTGSWTDPGFCENWLCFSFSQRSNQQQDLYFQPTMDFNFFLGLKCHSFHL